MMIKSVSSREEPYILREGGMRVVHAVQPGGTFEVSNEIGINLCKRREGKFKPATKEDQTILDATIPKVEPVKQMRKRTGSTRQAEEDLAKKEGGKS